MRKYIAYILLPFLLFSCSDRMEKSPAVSGGNGDAGHEEYDYNQGFSPMGGTQADPSENGLVVGDVVMPKSFAPCLRSDDLRLPMRGFSEGCNLKFKAKDGSEYTASVVDFDENGIIFNLPSEVMSGDYELYVERGGVRQNLGCRYIMCDTPAGTAGINVKGTVYISGKPASHVVVSDGYEFTVSDRDGNYSLVSNKANGYVFVQVPAHAAAKVSKAIPQFYAHISSSTSKVDSGIDFNLESCDHTDHRILFVTDMHLDTKKNETTLCTKYFMPDINGIIDQTTVPCYIFTAGDQTNELDWDAYFDLNDWKNYIADWKCPVYHCMGNHDNDMDYVADDFKSESTYKKILGPTWYSLDIGNVHYVVLDDIVYDNSPATRERGYYIKVTSDQLEYLKRDLLKVDPATPVVLITHCPLYVANGVDSSSPRFETYADEYALTSCLAGFHEVHIISGHTHINQNTIIMPGVLEHNVAASSGSTWLCEGTANTSLHICRDGTRGGYQIWDIKGKSISWVHKPMGKSVRNGQFHCVDLNEVPEDLRGTTVENAVLVNVYNWDDAWTISVKEDGRSLKVKQVYRTDPVYKLVFPEEFSSQVAPYRTNHLFMVTASSATSTLDITVTNRFGRVFTGTMKRPLEFKLNNYE